MYIHVCISICKIYLTCSVNVIDKILMNICMVRMCEGGWGWFSCCRGDGES